jgi:hypothetical protein
MPDLRKLSAPLALVHQEEVEKASLYLLFRYSLLQQKHEEPAQNEMMNQSSL